jgi:hypothetical protein
MQVRNAFFIKLDVGIFGATNTVGAKFQEIHLVGQTADNFQLCQLLSNG